MDIDNLTLAEIEELKKKLQQCESQKFAEYKGQQVLGFKLSLVRSRSSKNNKVYPAWKAYRCHKGKRHVVHIGKDPRNAQEKIAKYVDRHDELEQ
ncbi:hypothetical protein [Candidatus Uabimicrobium sp. HlEnr_7]|uniref:hypothetical protein n=1 Tax=Candidatus Uabimicrobium helgolandensis TaxID=3095367 RepID=UPI00355636B1